MGSNPDGERSFADKRVAITVDDRGMGLGIAQALGVEGAEVRLFARDEATCAAARGEFQRT